jgi:hypothetical protein
MNPPAQCLECGAPLRDSDLQGLCPKCLLKLGLLSQFGSAAEQAHRASAFPDGSFVSHSILVDIASFAFSEKAGWAPFTKLSIVKPGVVLR